MMYFFRPIVKLASLWFPWEKPIGFLIIVENKLCDQHKLYVCMCVYIDMKRSDAKASKCRLKFSSEIIIFLSDPYIYVQLLHFNCIENDICIAIRVELLNLNIAWLKCSF